MLPAVLVVLAVLIGGFLLVAALQSDDFAIERSIAVAAPPEFSFGLINNLRRWQEISPYVKLDPAAKTEFSGPETGVGAAIAWDGNSKLGAGRMTIAESRPSTHLRMRLEFQRPFKSENRVDFTFLPTGGGTTVTWRMSGKKIFVSKAMCLLMNMDRMIGSQFEEGLANIKARAESDARRSVVAGS